MDQNVISYGHKKCRNALTLTFIFIFACFNSISQPAGYGYSKKITIDATQVIGGSSFTDFPVMVRFTGTNADTDLSNTLNGGHVENINGYDIVFSSDRTGATLLDHQIEYYDGGLGEYIAWVKLPTLSNTDDTEIYMHYGNCSIGSDPSSTDTWNSDFDAVYFLHDDFDDATSNNNDGTNTGSTDTSPALVGDGQNFGINDYVEIPSSSISLAQGTVSIWAYANTWTGTEQYMFGHTSNPSGFADRLQIYTDDGVGGLDVGFGNNHNLEQGIINLATDTWNYIVLTWNGTAISVYVNGTLEHTENYNNFVNLESYLDIGNDGRINAGRNEGWNGDLDHARLSNEIFSSNWIETEYNNQQPNSNFLSVSSELQSKTYYSFGSGAWDSNTSWTLSSDGSTGAVGANSWPTRNDNVVIRNGHTITINATDDNYACGISANNLGRSNVGNGGNPFTGAEDAMFYHTGDILVSNGGELNVSEEFMIEGYTLIENGGTLSATEDVINLGYLEFQSTGIFDTDDDLILTGNSVTIMDNTSTAADDLYFEWTDATLCGAGAYNVGNGGADPTINYFNGATDAQICFIFTVTCTGSCIGVPATGTGAFISGNSGVGGIGDQNSLQLWLKADDLNLSNGNSIATWSDASGNGLTATADGGAGTEPTFDANTVNNTLPSISFDDGDYLNLGQPSGLDYIPGTDSWSFFIVGNITNPTEEGTFFSKADGVGGNRTYQYTVDDTGGADYYFSSFIGGNLQAGTVPINTGNWFVSAHSNNGATRDSWTDESVNILNDAIGTNSTGTVDVLIGARRATAPSTGFGFGLDGSIAEIAMYDGEMSEAQRIIITNYLSAKYDIPLNTNDVYTEDDNGFDFDVLGIGQASDGTKHIDSRGSGIIRVWNPKDLDNDEYLMIGHDNTPLTSFTDDLTEVDGTVIQQRLNRVWAVSETGDVGNVRISLDFSSFSGNALGSNLMLIIDRDGDFSTNDVTPITGTASNDIVVFSNVSLQDGDLFTIGNVDKSKALPIELKYFEATPQNGKVQINWETGTETNNDYFSIERSKDQVEWKEIKTVLGAGNSSVAIKYEETDHQPLPGGIYYRLKQTDFDGAFTYSKKVFVWYEKGTKPLIIYPNPSNGLFHIDEQSGIIPEQINIYDLSGKRISALVIVAQGKIQVSLLNYPTGIYFLRVMDGKNALFQSRLIKN